MYNNTNAMYAGYEVETNKESYTETKSVGMNTAAYQPSTPMNTCPNMMSSVSASMPGMVCAPVYECPQERVIHREIMHEVPQV